MIRVLLFSFILLLPTIALAQTMDTFQQIPFWNKQADSASYIEALYKIAISVAAILVVLRLIMAGVQYMFSEMITSKQKAKETIQSALLGLLIILGAVTILTTINPNLVNLNVIGTGAPVTINGSDTSKFVYDLKIGSSWSYDAVKGSCSSDTCFQDRVDYLERSCASNDGVLKRDYINTKSVTSCTVAVYTLSLAGACGATYVCEEKP